MRAISLRAFFNVVGFSTGETEWLKLLAEQVRFFRIDSLLDFSHGKFSYFRSFHL